MATESELSSRKGHRDPEVYAIPSRLRRKIRFQELDDLLNSPELAKGKLITSVAGYRLRAGMTCQRGDSIFHDWQEPKTEMEPVGFFNI